MINSKLSTFTVLFLLLIASCSTQPPVLSTQNAVRILDLNRVPVTLSAPVISTPVDPPTPILIPTAPPSATIEPTNTEVVTASPLSPPSPTAYTCTNLGEFVKNIATGDNTAFKRGEIFAKIWKVRNTGTCTWTPEYSLVYFAGEAMGGQPAQLLPEAVKPGETIDLRVDLTAPSAPGSYTGNWALKDNNGNLFGIGENGNEPLAVKIVVRMPAIPTSA